MRGLPLLILLSSVFAPVAIAQTAARGLGAVRLSEETRYYDVLGHREEDLLRALVASGPRHDGSAFFGLTSTEIRYTYVKTLTRTGCHLTGVEVHLRVVTTMPRWRPEASSPFDLERRWRSFERNLGIHENGHRQLALEEADMIRRALQSTRTTSCDGVDERAHDAAARIRDTYARRHRSYDVRTEHGRTQGAMWPQR